MSPVKEFKARQYTIPSGLLNKEQNEVLKDLETKFRISEEVLHNIIKKFHSEMDLGLKGEGGNLLMVPSYVTARPTGNEKGHYLALDFGGTNCRICLVSLLGNHKVEVEYDSFKFSDEQLKEHGEKLFSTIAIFVKAFLEKNYLKGTIKKDNKKLSLGYTFSFPVNMSSLNEGKLVRWTKGFENPGVVGEEVVSMLQKAMDHHSVPIKVNALVNDTVGTLVTGSYEDPKNQMGIILGTGTNAAYYEKMKNITKLNGKYDQFEEMAINIEWGAFDNDKKVLPLNEYDALIDANSWNPNQQIFEKSVSGFYLGEIFRLICLDLHKKGIIFKGTDLPKPFHSHGGIDTIIPSKFLLDDSKELDQINEIFKNELASDSQYLPSLAERYMLQKIAELIGFRAAQFAATNSTAVLLKRPELLDQPVILGVDGSVFEHFPNFHAWMFETCIKLIGDKCKQNVQFKITKDGSGIGAALISMIAERTALL